MARQKSLQILLIALLLVGLVACSRNADSDQSNPTTASNNATVTAVGGTPANPTGTQAPNGIAVGEPIPGFSQISLPLSKVTFSVSTPHNTPGNAPVYLSIFDLTGGTDKHIRMKNLGDGVYEAQADVLDGGLVRYNYDRFDADGCCDSHITREAIGNLFEMQYRFVLADKFLTSINDTVATWNDLRAPHDEGTITGRVADTTSGNPVLDADVSISGIHVGTRVDGTFKVVGLPPGDHKVVVHSDSGDFLPLQQVVTLTANGSAEAIFNVSPAKLVPVSFDVLLPDDTPEDAWIKLAGNIVSLGARVAHPSRPLIPHNYTIPFVERDGNTASAEFMLPEGAVIEYFYTLGPIGLSNERADQGIWVFRSFVVAEGGDRRSDKVHRWNNEGWPLVTLKLIPPANTPEDTHISLNMGPASWMERQSDGTYTTVLGSYPPGGTINYRYVLGDNTHGADASEAAQNGQRSLIVPESGGVIADTVTRWLGQLDPSKRRGDGSLAVTFRVSVPPETPADSTIFLSGNRPALGDGIQMQPLATNPWIYEAEAVFDHDGPLSYKFELRSEGLESFGYGVDTDFDGQVVNDWIVSWPGLSKTVDERDSFVKGIYTPDYFSIDFIDTSPSTYRRIIDHEASAVVISSVWSYGQTQPIPTLEYRAVRAGTVATPLEEAIEQSRIAHEAGLEIFFGPQFNMEQAAGGGEVYNQPKSDEWWTEWLKLADEMWTWQATVAEMVEAEYMMVPGPLFHVYEHIDKPSDDPFIVNFEAEQERLMAKVRGIYSGKLIVSGGNRNYDFPGLADFNGVTTYDVGLPNLPASTTVAQFVDYYETQFAERVDPIYEKWGNPVFFYTVHALAVPTTDDPSGEIAQANALEALFQVISKRPYVNGSLSWSYEMIDAPLIPNDGVRGRLGEAVLAKWYAILGGEN